MPRQDRRTTRRPLGRMAGELPQPRLRCATRSCCGAPSADASHVADLDDALEEGLVHHGPALVESHHRPELVDAPPPEAGDRVVSGSVRSSAPRSDSAPPAAKTGRPPERVLPATQRRRRHGCPAPRHPPGPTAAIQGPVVATSGSNGRLNGMPKRKLTPRIRGVSIARPGQASSSRRPWGSRPPRCGVPARARCGSNRVRPS